MKTHTLYQASVLNALMQGHFHAMTTARQLLTHGNMGLGTFEGLNGELILLGDTVYRAAKDGHISATAPDEPIAFACCAQIPFATPAHKLPPVQNYTQLKEQLNHWVTPRPNYPHVICATGMFSLIRTRSVGHYFPPYPSLAEAAQSQQEQTLSRVSGTLLGFYFPSIFKSINMPGWHLHFISQTRQTGGHVLELQSSGLSLQIMPLTQIELQLPRDDDFGKMPLEKDLSQEIQQTEG